MSSKVGKVANKQLAKNKNTLETSVKDKKNTLETSVKDKKTTPETSVKDKKTASKTSVKKNSKVPKKSENDIKVELHSKWVRKMKNTLETGGEDKELHSKRV